MTFIFSKVLPDPRLLAGHSRQSQPLPGVCDANPCCHNDRCCLVLLVES